MMCERLKSCPFCGGEARTFQMPQNTIAEIEKHPKWTWKNPGMWVVGCDTGMCYGNINNVTMCFYTERTAAKAWNRRADDEADD